MLSILSTGLSKNQGLEVCHMNNPIYNLLFSMQLSRFII